MAVNHGFIVIYLPPPPPHPRPFEAQYCELLLYRSLVKTPFNEC